MNIKLLSSKYAVRKLNEQDVEAVYELYQGNPLFFHFCPPAPTQEGVLEDFEALPSGAAPDQKYYVGFFDGSQLAAVLDLILGYPDEATAFIGLFMMCRDKQGMGVGSGIIEECTEFLVRQGYQRIRLAYVKGNAQSERFWLKNGFKPTNEEMEQEAYTAVVMEKRRGGA